MNDEIRDAVAKNQLNAEIGNWNISDKCRGYSVEQIREYFQPKYGYAVALMNVDGGLNIGSIIRTSVIFGASVVYIVGKRRFDRRSTVGSHNYIQIEFIEDNAEKFNQVVTKDGYQPICIEQGGQSIYANKYMKYENGSYTMNGNYPFYALYRPCIMFGSEKEGIPTSYLSKYPSYSIPQLGCMRSLNVASAAAIVLAEYMRNTLVKIS